MFFQNANNSVRVTDDFMRAVIDDSTWHTKFVRGGETAAEYRARDLIRMIAEAAHTCGDPGMQFDTTINLWHTCPASGRINASNPCSEYMHLDNSACNLSSLNLMKFIDERGEFDVRAFRHAVDVMITAQDIIVDNSSYPTDEIGANAHAFRELGLGYANLGALLMALGMPYDSDQGRSYAAAITALMTGEAYLQSARLAGQMGPFDGYAPNRDAMLKVIERHRSHAYRLEPSYVPLDLLGSARDAWDEALKLGQSAGYRNSQATVIAPTGTIAFMMDCDTTGIEPDIALVKYKKLVGGGMLKIVNGTVPRALKRLGYDSREVEEIVEYLDEHETIEGAPALADAHLPVFDCAFKPRSGSRTIHHNGHLKMMGAVQPFISGAISKTINMPTDATVDEVAEAYLTAWKLGLKAVAIYRDGSKRIQPLNTGKKEERAADAVRAAQVTAAAHGDEFHTRRRKLPDERNSITHKFDIAGHEGYITVGKFDDGSARRNLRHHVEAGLDDLGPDGFVRDRDFIRVAIRRCRCSSWWTSSRISASSRRASPRIRKSRTPNRLSITCSDGWRRSSLMKKPSAKSESWSMSPKRSNRARARPSSPRRRSSPACARARTPGCARRSSIRPTRRRAPIAAR